MKKTRVLNGTFDVVSEQKTLEWAREWIQSGKRGYICTVNVNILMMMRSNPWLQSFVDKASLTVADGQPIVWASKFNPLVLSERVTGVDLMNSLCACAEKEKFGIYFLGAEMDIVKRVVENYKKKYPLLEISGYSHGYFPHEESSRCAEEIQKSNAKILFVAMGVPQQESFLEEHWATLGINLAIPVGGSFDVIAGKVKRAPETLQKLGFEWFYRLVQEPKRLWKRYLVTNAKFVLLMLKDVICRYVKKK